MSSARVTFSTSSSGPAAVSSSSHVKPKPVTASSAAASDKQPVTKGAAMIHPTEFLTTKLLGCRVVVYVMPPQSLMEIEGTLLEAQDDDLLLLQDAVVYRNPALDSTVAMRVVVDELCR
eukprot:CAMPEP_0176475302 /NCGR_PEP_ID=MMETSP0127-20121128/43535_1 /TAXON_ID=938130 /ORGANISM="Platyophrya macrostoma, Strain WH" /LENGTH=118 /DNA_ID=CAMNT_0017870891 /DNA_START=36 /DNA_END=392 /DNA_ORIENTATION=+